MSEETVEVVQQTVEVTHEVTHIVQQVTHVVTEQQEGEDRAQSHEVQIQAQQVRAQAFVDVEQRRREAYNKKDNELVLPKLKPIPQDSNNKDYQRSSEEQNSAAQEPEPVQAPPPDVQPEVAERAVNLNLNDDNDNGSKEWLTLRVPLTYCLLL